MKLRTEREIRDMHKTIHELFERMEVDGEGKLKDDTEEEEEKGTILDYLDILNWIINETSLLEDILTDITEKYKISENERFMGENT